MIKDFFYNEYIPKYFKKRFPSYIYNAIIQDKQSTKNQNIINKLSFGASDFAQIIEIFLNISAPTYYHSFFSDNIENDIAENAISTIVNQLYNSNNKALKTYKKALEEKGRELGYLIEEPKIKINKNKINYIIPYTTGLKGSDIRTKKTDRNNQKYYEYAKD